MSKDALEKVRADAGLRPGQVVDERYRVDYLIAEGGMARVWAGHNVRVGKRVALKVIRDSFAVHAFATEMLRRESVATSRIDHPNVVTVFDVIEHEGLTCIVMELLQGESLAEYLVRRGSLSFSEAATLLLPAMRGVAAAYAQGVVHRDLKPGNIFLCRDSDGALLTIKVLDFGISKLAGRPADAGSDLTDFGCFGTPAYMAPEDISGSADADGRVDVYAFGVLLFECVTGRRPFLGEPGLPLLHTILTDKAPAVGSLRPDLPPVVQAIIDRALAKDPQDRYPGVEHLMRAIEAHLMEVPTVPLRLPELSTKPLPSTLPLHHLVPVETKARSRAIRLAIRLASVLRAHARSFGKTGLRRWTWRTGVVAAVLVGLLFCGWRAWVRPSHTHVATLGAPTAVVEPPAKPFRPTLSPLESTPAAADTVAAVSAPAHLQPVQPRPSRPRPLGDTRRSAVGDDDPFEHATRTPTSVQGAGDDDSFADPFAHDDER